MEILSVLSIVCLSFSTILLIKKLSYSNWKEPAQVFPIALLVLITLELFYGWLYSSEMFRNLPHLIRINTPFVFLIGPSVYFTVKLYGTGRNRWKDISAWHLLPFVLVVFYFIPFYLEGGQQKVLYLEQMFQSLSLDSILIGGLRRAHQGIYFFAVAVMLLRQRANAQVTGKIPVLIATTFGILWLVSIYRYFFQFDFQSGFIDISLLGLVSIVLVYEQLASERNSGNTQLLDKEQITTLSSTVTTYLESSKRYTDPNLTLPKLASEMSIPYPALSRVINKGLNKNFNELINSFRVKEAIRLLRIDAQKRLTMEAIAARSGFRSVSSFNTNFKRFTGTAPKSYRKSAPERVK